MTVVLVGTLDTKGLELRFVRDLLRDRGVETLIIDAGSLGPPIFPPDIDREAIFANAGTSCEEIRAAGDRGNAVAAAARGVAVAVKKLHEEGLVDAILAIGGSAGTTIGTSAMRALPFGVPKVMVSTLASGQAVVLPPCSPGRHHYLAATPELAATPAFGKNSCSPLIL